MRQYLSILPILAILSGCGAGDRVPPQRSFPVMNDLLCFSVSKSDVLTRYAVYSYQHGESKTLASRERVSLSYPESCIKVTLTPGYIYATSYELNGEDYSYNFFIDKSNRIFSTTAGGE